MKQEHFIRLTEMIRKRKVLPFLINIMDRVITMILFLAYPILLAYLYQTNSDFLVPAFLVPAVSFFIVSVFRSQYDAKRPYEVYDFDPVIKKNTKGKSFPSRHVFSVFVIAMTFFQADMALGFWVFLAGVILGVLRVCGGVHFIKDVTVGAVAGIVAGCIGYYLVF